MPNWVKKLSQFDTATTKRKLATILESKELAQKHALHQIVEVSTTTSRSGLKRSEGEGSGKLAPARESEALEGRLWAR
jgi:hypothetical protein